MQPVNEKPSRNEDEYFLKYDAELLKEHRERLNAARAATEQAAAVTKCPRDAAVLEPREFHHVMVDVCPTCGGVWLDAGELEQVSRVEKGGFLSGVFGRR